MLFFLSFFCVRAGGGGEREIASCALPREMRGRGFCCAEFFPCIVVIAAEGLGDDGGGRFELGASVRSLGRVVAPTGFGEKRGFWFCRYVRYQWGGNAAAVCLRRVSFFVEGYGISGEGRVCVVRWGACGCLNENSGGRSWRL